MNEPAIKSINMSDETSYYMCCYTTTERKQRNIGQFKG